MQGPDLEVRTGIGYEAEGLDSEEALEGLLGQIEELAQSDVESGMAATPEEDLAAIESWASLASHVTARYYAPSSPWPRSVAGWSKGAVAKLRSIANTLSAGLNAVAHALGAATFSIGVSFPWGISIGLSWS